jgi:hypothetical protein
MERRLNLLLVLSFIFAAVGMPSASADCILGAACNWPDDLHNHLYGPGPDKPRPAPPSRAAPGFPPVSIDYNGYACGGPGANKYRPGSRECFGGSQVVVCSGIPTNAGRPDNGAWQPTNDRCN